MEILIEPISSIILLSIGVALIVLEIILATFFIFYFGLSFVIVAFVNYLFPFTDGAYQLVTVAVLAMVFVFLLKDKIKIFFNKAEREIKEDFLNEEGIGEVVENMISYKGTLWEYEPMDLKLVNGQRVKVLQAKNNKVKIELI